MSKASTSSPTIKVVKPGTIVSIEMGSTELEILQSSVFQLLSDNLKIDNVKKAEDQIQALDKEIVAALKSNTNLALWKYQYLAFANLIGRFEAVCKEKGLLVDMSIDELTLD